MRKIFLILLLLACTLPQEPPPAEAFGPAIQAVISSGGTASAATDSCSAGGLQFSWHFENLNVTLGGVAGGVNNGCSVGDTTATAASAAVLNTDVYEDGANSGDFPTSGDNFTFDISSDDLINPTAGKFDGWIYFDSFVAGADIWSASVDGTYDLWMEVSSATTPQIRIRRMTRNAETTLTGNLQASTWYHVIAQWDTTAHSGAYIKICVDETDGTTNCGTSSSTPGTWSGGATTLIIGNGYDYHLDNMKIYGAW